jgi:light-regulated signal transduction histidine kinase (bacteriophytochrome)
LNESLNQALDTLRMAIDDARAEIRSAPLPVVLGDAAQLTHVFQNLISNAIKFRGPERPRITITVDTRDDSWVIAIADNGIGIPERGLDRIFELGARLHTRDEYAGSGIGLALCKRVVERHGGRIWAASQGSGSTFYVQLPRISQTSPSVSGNLKAHIDTPHADDRPVRERVAH